MMIIRGPKSCIFIIGPHTSSFRFDFFSIFLPCNKPSFKNYHIKILTYIFVTESSVKAQGESPLIEQLEDTSIWQMNLSPCLLHVYSYACRSCTCTFCILERTSTM